MWFPVQRLRGTAYRLIVAVFLYSSPHFNGRSHAKGQIHSKQRKTHRHTYFQIYKTSAGSKQRRSPHIYISTRGKTSESVISVCRGVVDIIASSGIDCFIKETNDKKVFRVNSQAGCIKTSGLYSRSVFLLFISQCTNCIRIFTFSGMPCWRQHVRRSSHIT